MRHVTAAEDHRVMQALADVGPFYMAMRAERDELLRRIELAVSMIDRGCTQAIPHPQALLDSLRAVLDEGARPDLVSDDDPQGTMREGMNRYARAWP